MPNQTPTYQLPDRDTWDTQIDPYRRLFTFPKWTHKIRVTDEPRLFRRLPEFDVWTKQQHHTAAIDFAAVSVTKDEMWQDAVTAAIATYGNGNGILISGVYREHFPDSVKDRLRRLAHGATEDRGKSCAHWRAAGKRLSTWRTMYQDMRK